MPTRLGASHKATLAQGIRGMDMRVMPTPMALAGSGIRTSTPTLGSPTMESSSTRLAGASTRPALGMRHPSTGVAATTPSVPDTGRRQRLFKLRLLMAPEPQRDGVAAGGFPAARPAA